MRRSIVGLLTGTLCTATAATAGVTALGKQVFDITGRELDLGWLGLAEFAPAALLVFVTGPVADRHDRRRVVAVAASLEAVAALGLAAYALGEPTAVWPIFALVLAFGVFRAFVAPAARALPADIVPPADLPHLVARFSIAWQASLIIGPVLAGFLYAADPALPYLAMAVLLVAGGAATLLVERPAPAALHHEDPDATSLRAAFEGLRFIRARPLLLGAISLDLFAVLFGGAVALLPAIAEERLGVGAVGLGWLRAATGIGAALTTLVLALRPRQRNVGRTLFAVVAFFGVFTIVLGMTRSYAVAFLALAVLSGADAVSVFIRATLVPLLTPDDRRGRVLAVENVFIGASNELGAFESGMVGQWLGAPAAIASGGIATIAVAGVWWWRFPSLRHLDGFPSGPVADDAGSGRAGDAADLARERPDQREVGGELEARDQA
jgi:MFS family permease